MHEIPIESKHNNPFKVINTLNNESIQSAKVIDHIQGRADTGHRFYSIEISNFSNLSLDFNDFAVKPLFTAVTWFNSKMEVDNKSVEPAVELINAITSSPTLLHLTCYELDEMKLEKLLKGNNIDNFLALRGDTVGRNQPFQHAIDLVKKIKERSPRMSLAVGGYPEVHPEAKSPQSDMQYLKEKVDAGAEFIITQVCFSATNILKFITQCRKIGIMVPIVPGIFIPPSYNLLVKMCNICKIVVPEVEFKMYKKLKNNNQEFQEYAVQNTAKIVYDLFQSQGEPVVGIHFFTLNEFELMKRVVNMFQFK